MPELPRLRVSIAFLVLANLIPVIGVLFWNWDIFYLLLLFWCENVVIGFFGILKVLLSGGGVFTSVFFAVHYGGFMFGHIMILFSLFSGLGGYDSRSMSEHELLLDAILNKVTPLPIIALFASHAVSFATNFLRSNERDALSPSEAMALPYKRMVITHVALIAGGFFLSKLGQPLVGLLLLVGMKIALDVTFHRREHGELAI